MKEVGLDKEGAERCMQLIQELRPDFKVEIMCGDYNLYKLGFIDYIPYTLKVDVTDEEWQEVRDEIFQMECDIYMDEEALYASSYDLSDEMKKRKKTVREAERKYARYEILMGI